MRLKRMLPFFMATLLFLFAFKQDKKAATISGKISDAHTKLPLNEAVITVSSTAFKGQRFALTDSTGMYRIGNLPAGTYTISFEMEGYEKFIHENLALQPGASLGASFEMVKERKAKDKKPKKDTAKVIAIKKEEG